MQKPFDVKGVRFGGGRPVVCVPVVERERTAVVDKIRALTGKGVSMIEWRADCLEAPDPEEVRSLLGEIRPMTEHTVMLFTLRTKPQGGRAEMAERDILTLDGIAAQSGCIDLVDLEYFELSRPEREIRRFQEAGVRVIASHHDFSGTPDDVLLHKVMDRLGESGADIAKLAVMPHTADDLIRLLRLTDDTGGKYPDLPLVTIAMGSLGVVSRVAGETFGSCITFGASGETSAPGQLQFETLGEILDELHAAMRSGRGHIYLIGFMGTGKTTVSGELKKLLGAEEIDLDGEIVREYGMSIAEMFEQYGEDCFRDRETDMLRRISGRDPAIVSCGGGCALRAENVSILKRSGTVVLLTAEPETVWERVKDDGGRPLLNGRMDVESIAGLMEERRPAYESACDLIVRTDGRTPEEIAAEIRTRLGG